MLPSKVSVRFRTRCCSGATPPPSHWEVEVDAPPTADLTLGGSPAKVVVEDAAWAVFSGGSDPINKEALTVLAKAIARETCVWRENQGDHVFSGVVAPEMNAQNDEVEWLMDDESCRTTFSSGSFVQECDRLMHHDPAPWCEVPCDAVEVYGSDMSIVDGKVRIPTYSVWLDDDFSPPRIRTRRKSQFDFRGCCGGVLTEPNCFCSGGLSAPSVWNWSYTRYNGSTDLNGNLVGPPTLLGTTRGVWNYFQTITFVNGYQPGGTTPAYRTAGTGWASTDLAYYDVDFNNNVVLKKISDTYNDGGTTFSETKTYVRLCAGTPNDGFLSFTYIDRVLFDIILVRRDYTSVAPGLDPNFLPYPGGLTYLQDVIRQVPPGPLSFYQFQPVTISCSPFVRSFRQFMGRTAAPAVDYYNTYIETS